MMIEPSGEKLATGMDVQQFALPREGSPTSSRGGPFGGMLGSAPPAGAVAGLSVADLPEDVTRLLHRVADGDREAMSRLLPLVYAELRSMAAARLSGERSDMLQPTALVHEAWMRLTAAGRPPWANRGHFYRAAGRTMRFILVDQARRRCRFENAREGIAIGTIGAQTGNGRSVDLEALDTALRRLEALAPRQADVVELHFFGGLTMEQAAEALGISPRTAYMEWRLARAYLRGQIQPD
jgi:RNA polymerase sigma-70 factor (ECF subfamily)